MSRVQERNLYLQFFGFMGTYLRPSYNVHNKLPLDLNILCSLKWAYLQEILQITTATSTVSRAFILSRGEKNRALLQTRKMLPKCVPICKINAKLPHNRKIERISLNLNKAVDDHENTPIP